VQRRGGRPKGCRGAPQARRAGDYAPDPKAARFPALPAVFGLDPSHRPVGVDRFLELWYANTHVANATKQAWSGKLRNLMKFAEKDDVAAITVDDVAKWRNARKSRASPPGPSRRAI
jgi:hypothetical protein